MQHEPLEYGVPEPTKVSAGKLSLRMFDNLWGEYKTNKTEQNLNELSKKYNLDIEKLNLLIEYYKPFKAHLQKKETSKEQLADQADPFEKPLGQVFSNIKVFEMNKNDVNKSLSDNQNEATKKLN